MKIQIQPDRPQPRQIQRVADMLQRGGLVAYPTDTVYGLGCDMFQKKAVDKVYRLKGKSRNTPLAFICSDLKDISQYAIVTDVHYRLMKRILPGPYTVILNATKLVPKVMRSKAATVGIRVPAHPVPRAIVEALGNPIVTTSIPTFDGADYNDPEEIFRRWKDGIDVILDSGLHFPEPSTIIDLTEETPRLLRQGKGPIESIGHLELIGDED